MNTDYQASSFLSSLNQDLRKDFDTSLTQQELIPLHLRVRKLEFWDQRPEGYENMTADQVKATGMFLLPCHLLKGTGTFTGPTEPIGFGLGYSDYPLISSSSLGRNTKRLYVGSLPDNTTADSILEFVNTEYDRRELEKAPGNPALECSMNKDKKSVFVDFRTVDECTVALALDGSDLQGCTVKVRRPKDYIAPTSDDNYIPGIISPIVPDTMFKVFVGGLPAYVSDEQVMDLLKAFGELKSFNLVKDSATGVSKGFAFCEFLDHDVTDIACEGLHGLEVGDKCLIVQRASVGAQQIPGMVDGQMPGIGLGREILPIEILGANGLKPPDPSTILMMLNMFRAADLEEDRDYDEILDDVKLECETFGTVKEVVIPRPHEEREIFVAGVGKVFVKYEKKHECAKAQRALAGRKYMDNTVLTTFFDEQKFEARVF